MVILDPYLNSCFHEADDRPVVEQPDADEELEDDA